MSRPLLLILVSCFLITSCGHNSISVVPYPNEVTFERGYFDSSSSSVYAVGLDSLSVINVKEFAQMLKTEFHEVGTVPGHGIAFIYSEDVDDEAYHIDIRRKAITVKASGLRGFVYAVQTLRQMMPKVPCCHIKDAPRFAYRGLHLDEARHYFGKEQVKRYLDIMAYHKLNTFHWHLTDDQGWRIEIRKYPQLTAVGSRRDGTCIKRNVKTNDGIPYGEGMWYSQEDIREIVQYAARKGIDVIPEIDLPGHMLAALAAYPHLGCSGGPYKVWHRWGVSKDVLCVGKEETYRFLEDVLSEVCELFPAEYIHIGGDECPKDSWAECPVCQAKISSLGLKDDGEHSAEHHLQSHVMNRVEEYLATKGKSVIGWDEILEGSPSKSAAVMSWRGEEGGIKAAGLGHDVIMTPNTYCYWDYYQATDVENEPFAIGGYIPVSLVYSYEPYSEKMDEEARDRILGVQANIWTEFIKTPDHLEYMLLPRLAALSEVQWCRPENKDWDRFLNSMGHICAEYQNMGYNYAGHIFGVMGEFEYDPENICATVVLKSQGNATVRYTLDGTDPGPDSPVYKEPLKISSTCTLKASSQRDGVMSRPLVQSFCFHKAVGRELTLTYGSESKFSPSSGLALLDGIRGPAIHKSREWCCWKAKPMEVVIDMMGAEPYSQVEVGYISNKPSQIFNPVSLEISVSDDALDFTRIAQENYPAEGEFEPDGLKSVSVSFPLTSARYLKVKADCLPQVPQWHHYFGRKASLYIDEVIVN